MNLSLQGTGFAIAPRILDRHQPHNWLRAARDDNFLSAASLFNQPGELSLCFVNGDGFHVQFVLAN